eukprot:6213566-Pleurochrysis_carterae.AAC.2
MPNRAILKRPPLAPCLHTQQAERCTAFHRLRVTPRACSKTVMRALVRFRLPSRSAVSLLRVRAPPVTHVSKTPRARSHFSRSAFTRGRPSDMPPSPFCVLRHAHALRPRCVRSCTFGFPLSPVPPRADAAAARARTL